MNYCLNAGLSLFASAGLCFFNAAAGNVPKSSEAAVPKPPLPVIRTLQLEPASLILEDGRDARRVLVWGETASRREDRSDVGSHFEIGLPSVATTSDGYVQPKGKGEGEVTVSAAGLEARLPVKVLNAEMPPVRFVRDVLPLLSKSGCNAGTCHGSAKGKNGFKLSLRGYDPDFDYQALINDISGRRFNRVNVEESLLLLKPTAEVPHEGRQAIKPGSREHQLLRQWIAEGTRPEETAIGRANKLEVLPSEVTLSLPGMNQQILVLAHYPDGSVREVTREAVITSSNGDVADIKNGLVISKRRGEAAVLVRYEGNYAAKGITVMGDRTGFAWADVPEYNYIDQHVNAKLKKMKIVPSDLCTDAEFIRRVSLDLTGLPPKPERVRAFLADAAPSKEKRDRLIDELLGSKDYVEYWANKWADLLQCNSESLGQKGVWVFRNWIQRSVEQKQTL